MIRAIFFDVANTLLEKPDLWKAIKDTLNNFGYNLDIMLVAKKHKELSEGTLFPDKTTKAFYLKFNEELLKGLDIDPRNELVEAIYQNCQGLQWRPFEDVTILERLRLPLGIGSNWDLSLRDRLRSTFGRLFDWILVSEELGVKKPQEAFFLKMIEVCAYKEHEILFVGDSVTLDMWPAQKVGMQTLLVDRINYYVDYQGNRVKSMSQIMDYL